MIRLKKCSKLFGRNLALNSVSLELAGNGLVLVLGGNGAGKSTLLRAFAGLLTPSSGQIEIDEPVSFLGHQPMLYPQLTVAENLDLFSVLCGHSQSTIDLDWLEIDQLASKFVEDLSQGQRARVGLARVLAGSAKTLLLDEPCAAFDQRWQFSFVEKLKHFCANRLTVIVTHDPQRYFSFAKRVLIVSNAAITHDFSLELNSDLSPVLKAYHEVLR